MTMRKQILLMAFCFVSIFVSAQNLQVGGHGSGKHITRQYNNVSMSKALMELNNIQQEYTVNFIYDELEDFRVTTSIRNKSVPDVVRQMIGFYPIRMTETKQGILFVECTHKTDRHLMGTISDEQGLPVAYANIALLSPQDSTLLSGGVSNESGYFAIPYESLSPEGRDRERILS